MSKTIDYNSLLFSKTIENEIIFIFIFISVQNVRLENFIHLVCKMLDLINIKSPGKIHSTKIFFNIFTSWFLKKGLCQEYVSYVITLLYILL